MFIFFLQNLIILENNILEYTDKNDAAKGGEVRQILTGLSKGGGGDGKMLTMADEGGREVGEMMTMGDKGGRGSLDPHIFG